MSNDENQPQQPPIEGLSEEDQKLLAATQDVSDDSELGVIVRENAQLRLSIVQEQRRAMKALSLAAILGVTILVLLFIWFTMFPKVRYIETRDNGPICAMNATDSPYLTVAGLTDFAKDAVLDSYTYDYLNYERQIQGAANRWFTDNGRKAFLQGLDSSGNLERVIRGRLTLRTMATHSAQLEEQGMLDPTTNYWVISVPISIEFYSGGAESPRIRQFMLATVTLVSVRPSADKIKGVAVDSIVLKPHTPRK